MFSITLSLNCLLPLWLLCGLFCFLRAIGCFKTCSIFFILLLLVQYLRLSLSQYFLNYSGCYSNRRPLQEIAAGGIWCGRASALLSWLLCTELKVMLSTSAPPLGLLLQHLWSVPQLASGISSLPSPLALPSTVPAFAATGIPRPFGIKCFVSQVLVFSEKWPPAFRRCLGTQLFLGTPQEQVLSHRHLHIFQKKIHHNSFEEGRKRREITSMLFFLETGSLHRCPLRARVAPC